MAEPFLREAVDILQSKQPDAVATRNAQSLLGGVLLEQKQNTPLPRPLLLTVYEGLKAGEGQLSPLYARFRVTEAGQRIVTLYEAWGKAEKAGEWQAKLAASGDSKPHH